MDLFVGRKKELRILETIWDQSREKNCVVYGRRRVGKSTLLRRFCENRRSIYIECIQGSITDNIHSIARVLSGFDSNERADHQFLEDALDDILEVCRKEKTLVVLDELPYLLSTGGQVASIIQHFVDAMSRETESMIIICGSSIAMMKQETTDVDRPLYGRFSTMMRIDPLSYLECNEFHPNLSHKDSVRLYLTVGGIPKYHLNVMESSYREFIERHFLSEIADMSDEAESIISAEFAPRSRYFAIINAIADGATSLKDISEKSGIERRTCSRCISELESVGIIGTEKPMFGSPKNDVYRIEDPMIAFSQNVVRESRAYALTDVSKIYDALSFRIDSHLGHRFESLCADYVVNTRDCLEIGRWWKSDAEGTIEVDIAATVIEDGARVSLFGECKFRNRLTTSSVFEELVDESRLAKTDATRRYILFSASGFSDDLRELEDEGKVELVDLERLSATWKKTDSR